MAETIYRASAYTNTVYRKSSDDPEQLCEFYREGEGWAQARITNERLDKLPFWPQQLED